MKKRTWRSAEFILLVVLLNSGAVFCQQQTPSAPGISETMLSDCRKLADEALQAFEKGDNATAAKRAHSLEGVWDASSAGLKKNSRIAFNAVDSSMDGFIELIIDDDHKNPDRKWVEDAYQAFIWNLGLVNTPEYGFFHSPEDHLAAANTSSGLTYVITKHGAGRQPKMGEIALVRMAGFVGDGVLFRQTKAGGDPEAVTLENGEMIPGILEGIRLLHVGDSAILVIPPALAYGAYRGRRGTIPPNSYLTYFIDLVDVKLKSLATGNDANARH
jgi:hypothetical protein